MSEFDYNCFFFKCFFDYKKKKIDLFIYNMFIYFDFSKNN